MFLRSVFLFAGKGFQCATGACFEFWYNSKDNQERITDMQIWIYQKTIEKKSTVIKIISRNIENGKNDQFENVIAKKELTLKNSGWISLRIRKIKSLISSNDGYKSIKLLLEFTCTHCEISHETSKQPKLFIYIQKKIKLRNKRNINRCSAGAGGCCLDSLCVDISALGWDYWILRPTYFYMNQCRGSCSIDKESSDIPSSSRYGLGKLVAFKKKEIDSNSFCCLEERKESLLVWYMTEESIVIEKEIHGMIVTGCECK